MIPSKDVVAKLNEVIVLLAAILEKLKEIEVNTTPA